MLPHNKSVYGQKKLKRPFVFSAVFIAFITTLMLSFGYFAIFPILVFAFILTVFMAVKRSEYLLHSYIALSVMLIAACAFTLSQTKTDTAFQAAGDNRIIEGTVYSYPVKDDSGTYSFLLTDCTVEQKSVPGKIYVYAYECEALNIGDKTEFIAYSLEKSADEGIFYYHSLSENIYLTAIVSQKISVKETAEEQTLYSLILSLKKHLSDKFFNNMEQNAAAIANSLITGDKFFLSGKINSDLRMSGISHIFAVSGMHLSIWTSLFFVIFKTRRTSKHLPNILASLFVLFYTVLTGFSPSVLRSGIMLLSVFVGRMIRRSSDSLNSLGLAATALLIYEPFLLGNVSFLLSFIATLTLIITTSKVTSHPAFPPKKYILAEKALYATTNPLILSLCVLQATMPVVSVFFGYFSAVSPFSSLLMTPVSQALMITGGAALIFPHGSFLSDKLFGLAEFLSNVIIKYISFIGQFDFSIVPIKPAAVIIIIVLSLILYFIVPTLFRSKRTFSVFVLICSAVFLIFALSDSLLRKDKTVIYIPENTCTPCISVYSYGNFSAVYGIGKKYSDASENISFLLNEGCVNADYLILPDCSGKEGSNARYLKERLSPKNILTNPNEEKKYFCFTAQLSEDANLYTQSQKDCSMAVLTVNNIKTVICSGENTEFPEEYSVFTSGDILICEGDIPSLLNKDNFKTVIILADKESDVNKNILTNKDKPVKITVEGESYAVN